MEAGLCGLRATAAAAPAGKSATNDQSLSIMLVGMVSQMASCRCKSISTAPSTRWW